jgi:uncharacterized protein
MNTQPHSTPRILWNPPDPLIESDCACASEQAQVLWGTGEKAEGDCACAAPAVWSSSRLQVGESWQLAPALYRAPLPAAHEMIFNPVGPAGVVVLNQPAREVLDTFCDPHPLTDEVARQLAALQLLTPVSNQRSAIGNQASVLTAWLHITADCNLRCAYCYLNKTGEAMTEETGYAAVDAVIRSAQVNDFQTIKLKYAGGEPTLNFRLVQRLHDYACHHAADARLELREVVLSNGVALTSTMIDWLRDENIRLMISLDGLSAEHDAQRTFLNGRGSFAHVARAVDRALARGLAPHLSITVTSRNTDKLAETVAFALERDLPFNLNFVRDSDRAETGSDLAAGHARLIAGMKGVFAVIEAKLPRRRLIDALVDRSAFDAPHEYPCGAGRNYLVIDQQGRVARCQMDIEYPVADVLTQDPLKAIRVHSRGFQNVSVHDRSDCKACIWRYWCAGGCPLLSFRTKSHSNVRSPYCDVYRALYPDVLRLEAQRLLKWNLPV